MKTTWKTIAVFTGLLLLAGCAALADDTPAKTSTPAYGPGWRHEQMLNARQNGQMPYGYGRMMMVRGQGYGPGMRGFGPAMNADGTIDTSKLPPWCPYADQGTTTDKTE